MANQRERSELLQSYKNGFARLKEELVRFPSEMWKYKPGPDKWSVHEVVVHIADTEVQSHVRCRTILAEPGATLMNFQEHQWSVVLNYLEQDFDEALNIISMVRSANYNLLQRIPEPLWQNSAMHSVTGKMTLEDWLRKYESHIPRHIGQMQRVYEAWAAYQKA